MTRFVIKRKPPPHHEYKVLIQVFEDGEKIASAGADCTADNFLSAISVIDNQVKKQWTHIIQMAHVASQ